MQNPQPTHLGFTCIKKKEEYLLTLFACIPFIFCLPFVNFVGVLGKDNIVIYNVEIPISILQRRVDWVFLYHLYHTRTMIVFSYHFKSMEGVQKYIYLYIFFNIITYSIRSAIVTSSHN